MMVFDADEWVEKTEKCNEVVSEIRTVLSDERATLIRELNRICLENGLTVRSITGSSDNSVFEIHFDGNTSNSIHFSQKFLKSLGMSFSVQRRLDRNAQSEMYLEVYPLEK